MNLFISNMRLYLLTTFLMLMANPLTSAVQDPPYGQEGAQFCRDIAAKIGGLDKEHPKALSVYLDRIRQNVLSDRVAFFFDVKAGIEEGRLVLSGEVERVEFKRIVQGVFENLGYTSVVNQIKIVPDFNADPDPFGVATAPHTLTWSKPDLSGIPMDETLLGEPVYLLKELPEVWLIKTGTGYWGYAKKNEIRRLTRESFIKLLNQPKATLLIPHAADGVTLPQGCRLQIAEWGEGNTCKVLMPSGETIEIPKDICVRNQRSKETSLVVEQAKAYLHAPYQLGGKNKKTGIDCSGLIQLSYRAIGVSLPRDAKQQYLGGHLILPCVREALQPGDAIYFMNDLGQVDHTGMFIGSREMIHATWPQVTINSLNPASTNYLKRFDNEMLGAKRFWW